MLRGLRPILYGGSNAKYRTFEREVKSVVLDWSGTTADAHVLAPAVVFVDVFEKHGVPITMKEARGPMGLRKDLHIAKILENPYVQERWRETYGRESTAVDVANMFADFVPMQLEVLPKYTGLLPGVAETVDTMRNEFGVKIGSTTGFTKSMVDVLLRDAKEQGYVPDTSVAGDEVPDEMGVRPYPYMVYQNMRMQGVKNVKQVVKVDDTVSGVQEGTNAGCWSVGVYNWSNYTDVDSMEQWHEMSEAAQNECIARSEEVLLKSGAHYVVPDLRNLPGVLDDINRRLANGEDP